MKLPHALILLGIFFLILSGVAFAVPPGKSIELNGKGAGKVVFNGKIHANKATRCTDCHQAGLFKMKKGADIMTMKTMEAGKFCGSCHNEKKAFGVKNKVDCSKCHRK